MILARSLIVSVVSSLLAFEAFSEPLPVEAQQRLNVFKKDLKGALVGAIKSDGLEAAVMVCKEVAPEIALRQSNEMIKIGRSGHRIRNSSNKAEPWMLEALNSFSKSKKQNERKAWQKKEEGVLQYAEPIYLKAVCLDCHGSNISPPLKKSIQEHYPKDQATGFELEELRGIFWVTVKTP